MASSHCLAFGRNTWPCWLFTIKAPHARLFDLVSLLFAALCYNCSTSYCGMIPGGFKETVDYMDLPPRVPKFSCFRERRPTLKEAWDAHTCKTTGFCIQILKQHVNPINPSRSWWSTDAHIVFSLWRLSDRYHGAQIQVPDLQISQKRQKRHYQA
jgi:hypothetical protein